MGSRCDQCEENYFYNRSWPGCQECPACYRLVKDKVRPQTPLLVPLEKGGDVPACAVAFVFVVGWYLLKAEGFKVLRSVL